MYKNNNPVGLDGEQLNIRSMRMTHNTWLRAAGVEDSTIGTLRLDKGEGANMLRRWNYSDPSQLHSVLLGALKRLERWYARELVDREAVRA